MGVRCRVRGVFRDALFPFLLSLVLFPFISHAMTPGGESRTYVQMKETSDSDTLVPFFEYLDFNLDRISDKNISFHFSGWLKYDLADESYNKKYDNDLQYAYLNVYSEKSDINLKLGRFYVFEGVAADQVDGIYAQQYVGGRLGLALYGGVPVETDFDDRDGDYIYGGRISDGIPGTYTLGISYLKEDNDSEDFREEAGADVWVHIGSGLEIFGKSAYNVDTSGWQEHNYYAVIGPFGGFSINPRYTWVDYENFFTSATTSAFEFAPFAIDPEETLQTFGGSVEYAFGGSFVLAADYVDYNYEVAGDAQYYGGSLAYRGGPLSRSFTRSNSFGLEVHRMDGDTEDLQYNEYRAYGHVNFGRFDLSVDLVDVDYEEEVNGEDNVYSLASALGFTMSKSARLAADIEYGKNPEFDYELKGFVKFLYRFGSSAI